MFLKKIYANNYRNYEELSLEFNKEKKNYIIHSPNGMGKSNLLEIIYYFSYMRSFRGCHDKELVQKNKDFFYIEGIFERKGITNNIALKYHDKKEILFNNKKVDKISDVFGKLLTVLFCSEDIFIINGSPLIKRKFFDLFLSTIDKRYLYYLKKYHMILKQKNFILKQRIDNNNLLSVYNIQLGEVISYIQDRRNKFISEINTNFENFYNNIGNYNAKIKLEFSPSIKGETSQEKIVEILEKNKKNEINFKSSVIGPHRDNYFFLINNYSFSKFASFGQTRLAGLVIKLIQAEYLFKVFNLYPILLLDDVILELDKEKQKNFLNFISRYKQIFITVTNNEYINYFYNKLNIFEIELEYGRIKKNNQNK